MEEIERVQNREDFDSYYKGFSNPFFKKVIDS